MKDTLFSIFMCARNAENTIEKAVASVLNQTCTNWELIIVDNGSTDKTLELIEGMTDNDSRIKGIHLERGIGWAKGASLCLEHANGEYMTFLAADDFLLGDGALHGVDRCIKTEEPDIVWIGFIFVSRKDKYYSINGGDLPEYKIYHGEDKMSEIQEIMHSVYYNSFFHFISIKLLRKYGIDFFDPFLGDCEGVTEAMCRADKSVILDQVVYALTENTSQTAGKAMWRYHVSQWKSIKKAVCEKGKYDKENLSYIATRIFNNNIGLLKTVCVGGSLMDEEMNPIEKTSLERLQYMEVFLEQPECNEMFYYAGREYYAEDILENVSALVLQCMKDGYSRKKIAQEIKWLDKLVWGLCEYNGTQLVKRTAFDTECFENVYQALCCESNVGMFGYELIAEMIPFLTEDVLLIFQEISQTYINYVLKRIYELLILALEIKKNGRMDEVVKIVQECTDLLNQVKQNVPEEELLRVVKDLKMVINIS